MFNVLGHRLGTDFQKYSFKNPLCQEVTKAVIFRLFISMRSLKAL
jgi:hypothetical protein